MSLMASLATLIIPLSPGLHEADEIFQISCTCIIYLGKPLTF